MTFTFGNFLVLVGAILFAVALIFFSADRGVNYKVHGILLSLAGLCVALGVLFGAPQLFTIH